MPWTFVILVNGFVGASFGMIIFTSALESIPKDLITAAKVDGGGTWRIIRDIKLPMIKWPILFIATYQTLSLLTSFEYILLLTEGGPGLFTTEVWALTAYKQAFATYFGNSQWGLRRGLGAGTGHGGTPAGSVVRQTIQIQRAHRRTQDREPLTMATTTPTPTLQSSPYAIVALRERYGRRLAYGFLILSIVPILIGYLWLFIATISIRTEGLLPKDATGAIGGFTTRNWSFITDGAIWAAMWNSLLIALAMVIGVGVVSTSAGYALARMKFPGRKGFLSMTLVLHAFRAEMLPIAIFFVLRWLGDLPLIGGLIGFNSVGGVALVMIALELPLGVWLMKGFFDNLAWDMERAALIDGASRFRVWWQIMLPQIRPGIAALSLFTFIAGWNAYLVPITFSIGTKVANMPVFLNQQISDTAPVNWNLVAAIGLFQMIPLIVFFLFTQELLLNIYAGGSKGGN